MGSLSFHSETKYRKRKIRYSLSHEHCLTPHPPLSTSGPPRVPGGRKKRAHRPARGPSYDQRSGGGVIGDVLDGSDAKYYCQASWQKQASHFRGQGSRLNTLRTPLQMGASAQARKRANKSALSIRTLKCGKGPITSLITPMGILGYPLPLQMHIACHTKNIFNGTAHKNHH